jgi:hypothetical protein
LRGAESALALAESLVIKAGSAIETLHLPVSKTDPQAIGCCRTWGCVCGTQARRDLCPYHSAVSLKKELVRRFGNRDGLLPEGCPLFPNADGNWCTKKGFVATVAELARRTEVPTIDLLERSTVGEHVWRVTGSRHLAALDVPIPIIKLLARWGSDVIERYIADAPLAALTRVYIDRVQASDAAARGLADGLPPPQLREVANKMVCDPRADKKATPSCAAAASAIHPFVASCTGKVHLVSSPPRVARTDVDRTPCGWSFKTSAHTMLECVPVGASCCERCGNELDWRDVHTLLAYLGSGYDSE